MYIYIYIYILFYYYFYFVFSWFSLKHMTGYPQSHPQWEIVHIAAYLTQRKLNTQQIIAYPLEKQDNIPKNKPKKALAILSHTTVRRSAVDQEDLKPYWKSEKRPHFSR